MAFNVSPSHRGHLPDAAGAGVGAEAATDAFVVIGDVLKRSGTGCVGVVGPGDGAGGADGFTQMTVAAGGAGEAAIRLLRLGGALCIRVIMGKGER